MHTNLMSVPSHNQRKIIILLMFGYILLCLVIFYYILSYFVIFCFVNKDISGRGRRTSGWHNG